MSGTRECGVDGTTLADWISRDELLELRAKPWREEKWCPRNGWEDPVSRTLSTAPTPGSACIPDGWDHDHCEVCWWKLHVHDNADHHTGFTDGEGAWLCRWCHASVMAVPNPDSWEGWKPVAERA